MAEAAAVVCRSHKALYCGSTLVPTHPETGAWAQGQSCRISVTMQSLLLGPFAFLAFPSNLVATVAAIGLLLAILRAPFGKLMATIALATLIAVALSPLANALLVPLELRFSALVYPDQGIEGIIVLGGSYDSANRSDESVVLLEEDTEPMAFAVNLARRYPHARIIFSGGSGPSWGPGPSESAIAKQYFASFGIAADRISSAQCARTTEQNARFTAALVNPKPQSRWLLVTTSYHMPLAMGAFRKAGFDVIAFPVGSRTHGWREMWWPATSATDNLRRLDLAIPEWTGLLVYKLLGYSDEWFPS